MNDAIAPNLAAMAEALSLSAELIADIELSRVPLANAALKAGRLARLLNDFDAQSMFQFEVSGYPSTIDGVAPDVWRLLVQAQRVREEKNSITGKVAEQGYLESIERLEAVIEATKMALHAAQDGNVSITSANPHQFVSAPVGNRPERLTRLNEITMATDKLASRRALIHEYALRRHYELKFAGVAQDVFSSVRDTVDREIGNMAPSAVKKFAAVHDNLQSDNPEDWSNAVHSCRRILQDLADAVYPPESAQTLRPSGKLVSVGPDNYINRLVCFAEDRSESARFKELVGSHLGYLGDRLDAIFQAVQKGSHAVVSRAEANRYVVYTYMLAGDILSLHRASGKSPESDAP